MREISNNTNAGFHAKYNKCKNIKRNMTEQLHRHTNTQNINRDPPEYDVKSEVL